MIKYIKNIMSHLIILHNFTFFKRKIENVVNVSVLIISSAVIGAAAVKVASFFKD